MVLEKINERGTCDVDARDLAESAGGPIQNGSADDDSVDGERGEAAFSDVADEPRYGAVGHEERNDEADGQNNPLVRINLRDTDRIFRFAHYGFEQVVAGGYEHRWNG